MNDMTILAGFAIGLALHDPLKALLASLVHFVKTQWAKLHDGKAYI